jgi:hypothetical protein
VRFSRVSHDVPPPVSAAIVHFFFFMREDVDVLLGGLLGSRFSHVIHSKGRTQPAPVVAAGVVRYAGAGDGVLTQLVAGSLPATQHDPCAVGRGRCRAACLSWRRRRTWRG